MSRGCTVNDTTAQLISIIIRDLKMVCNDKSSG